MSNIKIKWLITGAAFGYFIFHPLVHIISLAHFFGEQRVSTDFTSDILSAFSISMLPWSIAFMILNALIGYSWGKIKLARAQPANPSFQGYQTSNNLKAIRIKIRPPKISMRWANLCDSRLPIFMADQVMAAATMPIQTATTNRF